MRGGWTAATIEERLYPGFRRVRSGSGFVVAEDGYILTSARLLSDSSENVVEFVDVEFHDDRHRLATVVGLEPTIDLAVLRLVTHESLPPPKVVPVTLGDSDRVLVGHWTIGVGNPWGAGTSYTVGTLSSAPDRQCYQEQLTATMMRSTLRLPEESFGGPLVDIQGHVVGLTTRGFDDIPGSSAETSAIPINLVRGIYESLRVVSSHESPWLGFSVLDLAAARRRPAGGSAVLARTGVYIDDLFEPSPAASADIRIGDCLVAIDGERLFSPLDFQKWLYLNGIGATMTLEIYRDGTTFEKEVTIERRPRTATTR
jgi:S1-C subfamily serine protease